MLTTYWELIVDFSNMLPKHSSMGNNVDCHIIVLYKKTANQVKVSEQASE
jgi:hypothetical protein